MENMGVIARNENQMTLIYSSNTRVGTHALSYLTAIDGKYLAIDLAKTKISDTMWVEIAEAMGVKVGDLVDKRKLDLDTKSTKDFGTNDWLKIIQKNDSVISKPIASKGNRTVQIEHHHELLEFFEVDSAGLKQGSSQEKDLDLERTTKNQHFIPRKDKK